jgi:hypothetical protein
MLRTLTHPSSARRLRVPRARVLAAGAVAILSGCSDSNVPFFTEPTTVAETPSGVQDAMTGMFGVGRADGIFDTSIGFARDGSVFTNTEPRTVLYPLGVEFIPNTSGGVWALEFQAIRQEEEILAAIPGVVPAYTAAQAASLNGIVQTWKAFDYMEMLEAHDTLGVAILASPNQTTLPQAVCMKDGWEYVVAILDSANTDLDAAGSTPPPITLPTGLKGVGVVSGPGTVSGSFASFNRALTVKALLELAYAIPRTPPATAGAPTPTTPGSPDQSTLARALSLLDSTAMFNASGALLTPTPAAPWTASATVVTWDFSGVANDVPNSIDEDIGEEAVLNDLIVSVDTVNDLRWKTKFIINPVPVQQQTYNPVATETHFDAAIGHDTTYSYLYFMSPTLGSPIPILRSEGLTLIAAQIHLGMGDNPGALALVNQVRTIVGGPALAPYPGSDASSYVTTRDDLMREQRISLTWEASADRTIAIRMYGLAAVADTTWGTPGHPNEAPGVTSGDLHTTVVPIPSGELNGRGETSVLTTTCS